MANRRLARFLLILMTIFLLSVLALHIILDDIVVAIALNSVVYALYFLSSRKNPLFKLFLTLILTICLVYIVSEHNVNFDDDDNVGNQDLSKQLLASMSINNKYGIFFLDNNQNNNSSNKRRMPTTKQACSIESAARNNPNSLTILYTAYAVQSDALMRSLRRNYANLKIARFDPENLFANTPLDVWWKSKLVFGSNFSHVHITDAFKYT